MKNFGCTTPFGRSLENVCTNETKAKMAKELYVEMYTNTSCLYPCKQLSNFILKTDPLPKVTRDESVKWLSIVFKKYSQASTSKCIYDGLDLFSAVGGFMGLFLGASINQIQNGFSFLIRRFMQSNL